MNLKNKFRILRKQAGFTLVELIVVIAIIAVLGGVAVPAYSGYIEKADRAADAQLLADVNKAFAAACMVEGVDNYDARIGATAKLTGEDGNKIIDTIAVNGVASFDSTFDGFFDNEGAFKKTNSLMYSVDIGGFKDPATAEKLTLSYAGGIITLTGEQLANLKESTFLEKLTSSDLLNQVNDVAEMAKNFSGAGYTNVTTSKEFLSYFADAMGIDASEFNTKANVLAKQALLDKGYTEAEIAQNGHLMQDEINKFTANAMVLYTAKNSAGLSATEAKNLLTGITAENISNNMQSKDVNTNTTGVTQAALAYGMYYAYVNSDACKDPDAKNNVGILTVTQALENEAFQEYLKSPQGTTDMEGYLSAMQMINSSASTENNASAVEDLIVNGFNNDDLKELIGSATA